MLGLLQVRVWGARLRLTSPSAPTELNNWPLVNRITAFTNQFNYTQTDQLSQLELQPLTGPSSDLAFQSPARAPDNCNARLGAQFKSQTTPLSPSLRQLVSLANSNPSDTMKFSHSLLFNSVPEWASYYLK